MNKPLTIRQVIDRLDADPTIASTAVITRQAAAIHVYSAHEATRLRAEIIANSLGLSNFQDGPIGGPRTVTVILVPRPPR
jgi:hypothetical protein